MFLYGLREALLSCLAGNTNFRVLVNMILKNILFGQYHTWFIVMLIGLYMITPFLSLIVQKKENAGYFLILSFLFTSVIPLLGRVAWFDRAYAVIQDMNMHFVVGYSMYYVLGYYLTHEVAVRPSKKFLCAEAGICAALLTAACLICDHVSRSGGVTNHEIVTELSPVTVILCSCIMLLFRRLQPSGEGSSCLTTVGSLARYGLVIYIVHPLVLWALKPPVGLLGFLYAAAAWGLSLGIAVVVSKVPVLRKLFFI